MRDFSKELRTNAYSTDASGLINKPINVFLPTSIDELKTIISTNTNITIRGGGSGLNAGASPSEGSVVVDMSRMDKVLSIDNDRMIIEVQAGIILDDLNEELSIHGLEFPINPLSSSICTIGGMIATNAAGPRSAKYKRMADQVIEVTIINGEGKELRIGRIDSSNVVGMEGITGVIVSAKIRVIKKKIHSLTIYRFEDMNRILDMVRKLKLDDDVSMIQLLSPSLSEISGLSRTNHLVVEFESDRGEIKGDIYNNKIRLVTDVYKNASLMGYSRVEDYKLFLDRLVDVANYLIELNIPYHANLGIGVINPIFLPSESERIQALRKLIKRMRGNFSGSLGLGKLKKEFMDINDKKLAQRVKKRYDPKNKLNRGVIVDADENLGTPTKEAIAQMIKKIDEQEEEKEEALIRRVINQNKNSEELINE